jgi:BCCT family betaine/carnitine transporter
MDSVAKKKNSLDSLSSPIGSGIDKVVFGTAIAVILFSCIPLILFGEKIGPEIVAVHGWITLNLGIFYQWATIAVIIFLTWLAFSRYGKIKLGPADEPAEFSLFSWSSMLFCAGIGAGLMYWSVIEWGYYIDAPPYGVEARSTEAITWAASYGLFHWGVPAWCLYCFPTLAIAVPFYLRSENQLRLSISVHEVLNLSSTRGVIPRTIDLFFILALIGGSGTSLGLVTPMISAVVSRLTGIETSFGLNVAVLMFCVVVFGTSVYMGLEKGIRRLSNINVIGLLLLLSFVLIAGPTLFILRMGMDSLGFMIQNTIRMITWTDPIDRLAREDDPRGFIENYTVFYWAWWIAYAPFVGLFVARISKGRTIREVILGMSIIGSLGCALLYMVFGNYALYLELNEMLPFTQIMNDQGPPEAIAETLATLPAASLALFAFAVIAVIFTATTYDSASYALASAASEQMHPDEEPARWHRAFWACGLIILPITLMFIDSQAAVLSASMIVSLPLLILGFPMSMSMMISLRAHLAETNDD